MIEFENKKNIDDIYEYSKTRYVPPKGKVLLIVGQEKNDIQSYIEKTGQTPGGLASYWAVSSSGGIISDNEDVGAGQQNLKFLVNNYPNTVIQSAMWLVRKWRLCERVLEGEFDKNIELYINYVKTVNNPIYLRIGYEFDGIHNKLEPDEYVRVYKYIVDKMRREGVDNVAYVWHSYASRPYKDYNIKDYYPGDDYVDWFAISVFEHFHSKYPGIYMENVINMARLRKKPVMIAESAPVGEGGIKPNSYETWNNWFTNYFNYIYKNDIKAISYISCNWDKTKMFEDYEWGNTKIQDHELIMEKWLEETKKEKYLKASDELFSILD